MAYKSPIQHQAIIWNNAGLLSMGPIGTNFSEISIKIQKLSFMNGGHFVQGEMSSTSMI